ncbi:MAG: hypothetical protein H5T73_11395 [Actinobacteria bacterium]|nr:hypothetical protein [Actinomycetota bacterium]
MRTRSWFGEPRARKARNRPFLHLVTCLSFSAMLLLASPAHGEAVISVTPTRIPLSLVAGERTSTSLTLTNLGEGAMRLLPRVLAVTEGEGGKINLEEEEACDWVILEQGELLLEPLMQRQVEVTVAPPADAAPGLRRLALTFIQAPEGGGDIGVTGGLAVLLELDVLAAEGAAASSFPFWLPALSVSLLLLAMGALLALQRFRKQGVAGKALRDDGGGEGR